MRVAAFDLGTECPAAESDSNFDSDLHAGAFIYRDADPCADRYIHANLHARADIYFGADRSGYADS